MKQPSHQQGKDANGTRLGDPKKPAWGIQQFPGGCAIHPTKKKTSSCEGGIKIEAVKKEKMFKDTKGKSVPRSWQGTFHQERERA